MNKNNSNSQENIVRPKKKVLTERLRRMMECLNAGEQKAREQNYSYMDLLPELQQEVYEQLKREGLFELTENEIGFFEPYGNIIEKLYNNCLDRALVQLIKQHPAGIISPFNKNETGEQISEYSNLLEALSQGNDPKIWHALLPDCLPYIELAHITPLLNNVDSMHFFIQQLPIMNTIRSACGLEPLVISSGDICYQLYSDKNFDALESVLRKTPLALFVIFQHIEDARSLLECLVVHHDRAFWERIKKYCLPLILPEHILPILDNADLFFDDFLYDIFHEIDKSQPTFDWNHIITYNLTDKIAPISLAAIRGHDKIFDFLLSKGASLDERLHNNETVLDNALLGLALKYMRSLNPHIFSKKYSLEKERCIEQKKKSYLNIIKTIYDHIQHALTPNTPETAYDFSPYSRAGTPFISAINSVEEAIILKAHIMTQSCARNNIHFAYNINTPDITNRLRLTPLRLAIEKYLSTESPELLKSGAAMIQTILKVLKPDLLNECYALQGQALYQLDRLPQAIVSLYAQRLKEQLEEHPEKKSNFFRPLEPQFIPYRYEKSYAPLEFEQSWRKMACFWGKTPLHQAIDCKNAMLFEILAQAYPQQLELSSFLGKTPVINACLKTLDNVVPAAFFESVITCYKSHNARYWMPLQKISNPYPQYAPTLATGPQNAQQSEKHYLEQLHHEFSFFMSYAGYTNTFLEGATILDLAFYWGDLNMLKSLLFTHRILESMAEDPQSLSPVMFLCQVEERCKKNKNIGAHHVAPIAERIFQVFSLYQQAVNMTPDLTSFLLGDKDGRLAVLDYCLENDCSAVLDNIVSYFMLDVIPRLSLEQIGMLFEKASKCLEDNNIKDAKKLMGYVVSWCQRKIYHSAPLINITNPLFYKAFAQVCEHQKSLVESFCAESYIEVYLSYVQKSLSYDTAARTNLPFLLELLTDIEAPESCDLMIKLLDKGLFNSIPFAQLSHMLQEKLLVAGYEEALLAAAVLRQGMRTMTPWAALSLSLENHLGILSLIFEHKLISSQELYQLVTKVPLADFDEKQVSFIKNLKELLQKSQKGGKKNKSVPYKKVIHYLSEQLRVLELAHAAAPQNCLEKQEPLKHAEENALLIEKESLQLVSPMETAPPIAIDSEEIPAQSHLLEPGVSGLIPEEQESLQLVSSMETAPPVVIDNEEIPAQSRLLEPEVSGLIPEEQDSLQLVSSMDTVPQLVIDNEGIPAQSRLLEPKVSGLIPAKKRRPRHFRRPITFSPELETIYEIDVADQFEEVRRHIESSFAKRHIPQAIAAWQALSLDEQGRLSATTSALLQVLSQQNFSSYREVVAIESLAFIVFSATNNKLNDAELHRILSLLSKERLSDAEIALLHILENFLNEGFTDKRGAYLTESLNCLAELLPHRSARENAACMTNTLCPQQQLEALITPTSSQLAPLLLSKRFDDLLYCWDNLPEFSRQTCDRELQHMIAGLKKGDEIDPHTMKSAPVLIQSRRAPTHPVRILQNPTRMLKDMLKIKPQTK